MPLFDYRCNACHRVFEVLLRGDAAVICPDCNATDVERLIAVPARSPGHRGATALPDLAKFGPPPGGGCCGGSCAH